jgi:hypothetical protein
MIPRANLITKKDPLRRCSDNRFVFCTIASTAPIIITSLPLAFRQAACQANRPFARILRCPPLPRLRCSRSRKIVGTKNWEDWHLEYVTCNLEIGFFFFSFFFFSFNIHSLSDRLTCKAPAAGRACKDYEENNEYENQNGHDDADDGSSIQINACKS